MEGSVIRSQSVDAGLALFMGSERKEVDDIIDRRMTAPEARIQEKSHGMVTESCRDSELQQSSWNLISKGEIACDALAKCKKAPMLDASPLPVTECKSRHNEDFHVGHEEQVGISSTDSPRAIKRMSEDNHGAEKKANVDGPQVSSPASAMPKSPAGVDVQAADDALLPRQPPRCSPALPMSQRPIASYSGPSKSFSLPPRQHYMMQQVGAPHYMNAPPPGPGRAYSVYQVPQHPHSFPARTMSYPDGRMGSNPMQYQGFYQSHPPPQYPPTAHNSWSFSAPVEENPLDVFAAIAMAQAESCDRDSKHETGETPYDSGIGSSPTHNSRRHSSMDGGHGLSDSTEEMASAYSGARDSHRATPDTYGSPGNEPRCIPDGVRLLSQAAMVESARELRHEGHVMSAASSYPPSWQPTPVASGLNSPVVPSTPTMHAPSHKKTPRMSRKNSSTSTLSDKGSAPSENRRERNKEAAQLCRQRKKNYMHSIEEQAAGLVNEKLTLSAKVAALAAQRKQLQALHEAVISCNEGLMDELRKLVAECRKRLPADQQQRVTAVEHAANVDFVDDPVMFGKRSPAYSAEQNDRKYRDFFPSDGDLGHFRSAMGYSRSMKSEERNCDSPIGHSHQALSLSGISGVMPAMKIQLESLHVHSRPCVHSASCDGRANTRLLCSEL